MQKYFYVEGKDITNAEVLAELAEETGVEKHVFLDNFSSEAFKLITQQGFGFSRQIGVQGFPTLLTLENGKIEVIARGFQDYDSLKMNIDRCLKNRIISEGNGGPSCTEESCKY